MRKRKQRDSCTICRAAERNPVGHTAEFCAYQSGPFEVEGFKAAIDAKLGKKQKRSNNISEVTALSLTIKSLATDTDTIKSLATDTDKITRTQAGLIIEHADLIRKMNLQISELSAKVKALESKKQVDQRQVDQRGQFQRQQGYHWQY